MFYFPEESKLAKEESKSCDGCMLGFLDRCFGSTQADSGLDL